MTRPRALVVAALLALTLTNSSCSPQMARFAATAFVVTAAAVTIMAIHDAHMHSHHCGHHYVVVEEEPVYYYQGRWEYYDEDTGRWYRYRHPPPGAEEPYYEVY